MKLCIRSKTEAETELRVFESFTEMHRIRKKNFDRIKSLTEESYLSNYPDDIASVYTSYFRSKWPNELDAVIFYGSCLNERTRKETSTPDFFLITGSYRKFHKSIWHTFLNYIYTPSTYSIRERELKGKYNVISMKDLRSQLSNRAKDIYNLGRLSKRTALIYCRNDRIRDEMLSILTNAFYAVTKKIYYTLPSIFTLEDFVQAALNISYVGERRVEADDKVSRLISSESDFYAKVYGLILEDLTSSDLIIEGNKSYVIKNPQLFKFKLGKFLAKLFIWRSRIRAKLRWPKSIYTFEGWVDTLISKIERAKGIKIELSEKERRHPLIYGWKYYYKLKKDKMLK